MFTQGYYTLKWNPLLEFYYKVEDRTEEEQLEEFIRFLKVLIMHR